MTIWRERQGRHDGGFFAAHALVAHRAAQLLRTRTGADNDVVLDGRLVSVAPFVPRFDPCDPPTDEQLDAAIENAARQFAIAAASHEAPGRCICPRPGICPLARCPVHGGAPPTGASR